MTYGTDRTVVSVTIPNGGSLSAEINANAKTLVGIRMSAAWTTAALTFQSLIDDPSGEPKAPVFGNVVDQAGAEVTIATPTAGTYCHLTVPLRALGRMKVRSGTSGTPVSQGADRALELVFVDNTP